MSVTVRVPAKVNLQLGVGPLRDDGYHDLVNVFHAVSLFDEVTVTEGPLAVTVEGASIEGVPTGPENLAARAAVLLAGHLGVEAAASIHIRKEIPVAGGMAGGSADAAAALLGCAALWNPGLPLKTLMELGGQLGSDVPFALLGGTAVGVGRGEVLTPLPTSGEYHWIFALAEGGLSTPAVYAECDRLRAAFEEHAVWPHESPALLAALAEGDAKALGAALTNDLQPAALSLMPSLQRTIAAGRDFGALGALVSGSGPTCAFLAGDAEHAADIAAALRGAGVARAAVAASGPVPGATVL
ncbi:4-diphosphocytidyl-2-C-methyl-D-erythritol kinase [Actinocorallia herbida]|uniref:4-diphosphocytidyl-2-C-methyl-D-erythritol kinase n=1 Tax=Actinocorallia herbida TaxID=58109 RepID=A0A3N1CN08_9ACTN|nr:4-(cytidine 5'-diphospho)-2-C-methyl-D-erythritol kinase [Actinocorallia herbida]ROO82706.1 4-diphosphocytidyl-2-C-methyl-D-erythritol kinase [Actinocorallia herbida]